MSESAQTSCISMALWKIAWAIEAFGPASG